MWRALRSCLVLISAAELGCSTPSAQSPRSSELLSPERVVAVALTPLACGVRVRLRVAPGYHIMSNRPSAPNFIATSVTLASPDVSFEPPIYPQAIPYQVADHSIATFRGDTDVLARCASEPRLASAASIELTLRYQACTQSACLFPVTRHFSTRIALEPRKTAEFSAP